MHFLTFSMHFDRDKGLDQGRLCLRHLELGTLQVWIATTSTGNKQYAESFHERGGVIPPEYRCGIPCWQVSTNPIPMPNVKGVEGSFYKIDPHVVTTDKGGSRGDFGIHLDANQPGSLGCIVMTNDRFKLFEAEMKKLSLENLTKLPLFVTYS